MKSKEEAIKKAKEKREARELEKNKALEFINSFKASGKKYISIRIRDGYIGKEVNNSLQLERAKPRGTLVAIKGDDNDVYIGGVYKAKNDAEIPAVGVAEALKKAIENYDNKENIFEAKNKNDKELYDFFMARAKCYFWPELYSHSRGTQKIEYKNYDKVHKNRERALKVKELLSKQS